MKSPKNKLKSKHTTKISPGKVESFSFHTFKKVLVYRYNGHNWTQYFLVGEKNILQKDWTTTQNFYVAVLVKTRHVKILCLILACPQSSAALSWNVC